MNPVATPLPWLSPRTLLAVAFLGALAIGPIVAWDPRMGIALSGGLVLVTVTLLALPVALAVWVVAAFASGLPGLPGLPAATTLLVGVACIATMSSRVPQRLALRRVAPLAVWGPVLLWLWMATTVAWAADRGVAGSQLWMVLTAIATVPIIALCADRPRTIWWIVGAYVTGGAMIVALAVVLGPSSYVAADASEGRLQVANFSANLLGAVSATGLVLVPALLRHHRESAVRWAWLGCGALLLYGLVGSQSRSGFVALIVALVTALVVCRGQRRQILTGAGALVLVMALFVAVQPGVLDRVSSGDSTGTGRTELWRVGAAVAGDHPLFGAGVGNFVVVSHEYALRVGPLDYTAALVDKPLAVHNTVLESWAETGIVGLLLLVVATVACFRATLRAARQFGRARHGDLEFLSRLVFVAQVTIVSAGLFLPMTYSRQLWMLLALGPALNAVAARTVLVPVRRSA